MRTVVATRYVTPLREGGSLPALVEADDDGLYVLKFRGAGQGPKALVAEVVVGELARALGFPVPELVLIELDATIGRAEPDREIQDLLLASDGLNLGVDFLPGSLPFSPAAGPPPDPDFAADVVWLDAFVTNVDRTARNTNMLMWHRRLWLIDHGATLYFHHSEGWTSDAVRARTPFAGLRDHILLRQATTLDEIDARSAATLTAPLLSSILDSVPDEWLTEDRSTLTPADVRAAYSTYLVDRLVAPRPFLLEAGGGR